MSLIIPRVHTRWVCEIIKGIMLKAEFIWSTSIIKWRLNGWFEFKNSQWEIHALWLLSIAMLLLGEISNWADIMSRQLLRNDVKKSVPRTMEYFHACKRYFIEDTLHVLTPYTPHHGNSSSSRWKGEGEYWL